MQDDPIIAMLKENGLSDAQISFLVKVLARVRSERTSPGWDGPDTAVKSVLEQEVKH